MNKYMIWVRINALQTAHTIVYAENDFAAKQLAEVQYGVGMVLKCTRVD